MSEGVLEQILTFRFGGHLYGLEVGRIQEVVKAPEFFYIPRAGKSFAGAINFHGRVVPVLDLPVFAGQPVRKRDSRVIVLPPAVGSLGFTVESIHGLVLLEEDAIQEGLSEETEGKYVRCLASHEGQVLRLFDVERLLRDMEHSGREDRRL